MNPKIFKAYDIRGKYPWEINERVVLEIAEKLPKILQGKVIIGRDARLSSPALYKAILKGLKRPKSRIKVVDAGVMTSPMLYFLVNKLRASGGIMVTASHNPKEYNGLKIVGKYAQPLSGQDIYEKLYK